MQRRLAAPPPPQADVFFSSDYDRGDPRIGGLAPSGRHFAFRADAPPRAIPVTYRAQVYKLAPGVDAEAVAADLARLADMPTAYDFLRQTHPDVIYWQYTALDEGVHTSFPGHGGYPDEFDPRTRDWYTQARDSGGIGWIGPYLDASSEQLIFTISAPVYRPDGAFAGVTALDVTVADVIAGMTVAGNWSESARSMLVRLVDPDAPLERSVQILAQPGQHRRGERWNAHIDAEWLSPHAATPFAAMVADMAEGVSGARRMPYRGRDCLWVYGPLASDRHHLLMILPYDEVVAEARQAEADVIARTHEQLRDAGALGGLLLIVVLAAAIIGARTVTRPVRDLTRVATAVAEGHFDVRAPVRSGDELGRLAQVFNEMTPKLEDQMRLKQSLDLAMEVQQRLLPRSAPDIEGLDVAGSSDYCDETGGDYFDFLELASLGPRKLGVAVGDVVGHGVSAALLMTTARAVIRSQAGSQPDLAALMTEMNRILTKDMTADRFMTMMYMVVDADAPSVRWVSAGHDPMLLYDPRTDTIEPLEDDNHGVPLGIDPNWRYRECGPRKLHAGQVLFAGTDGVWEQRDDAGEMFGKERLGEVIRAHAGEPAAEIQSAIRTELNRFRGGRAQGDDVTMVIIKITSDRDPASTD
ncbi:MAG: HAMP domain-containing protein [Planctomycetota bacterium]|nr:MAG: HAMP domain-containing protein [Planctomycetota bacterium]